MAPPPTTTPSRPFSYRGLVFSKRQSTPPKTFSSSPQPIAARAPSSPNPPLELEDAKTEKDRLQRSAEKAVKVLNAATLALRAAFGAAGIAATALGGPVGLVAALGAGQIVEGLLEFATNAAVNKASSYQLAIEAAGTTADLMDLVSRAEVEGLEKELLYKNAERFRRRLEEVLSTVQTIQERRFFSLLVNASKDAGQLQDLTFKISIGFQLDFLVQASINTSGFQSFARGKLFASDQPRDGAVSLLLQQTDSVLTTATIDDVMEPQAKSTLDSMLEEVKPSDASSIQAALVETRSSASPDPRREEFLLKGLRACYRKSKDSSELEKVDDWILGGMDVALDENISTTDETETCTARWTSVGNEPVLAKRIMGRDAAVRFNGEVEVRKLIQHPSVTPLYGASSPSAMFKYIIEPFSVPLLAHLETSPNAFTFLWKMEHDVRRALLYLTGHGISKWDLSDLSIFTVNREGRIVINRWSEANIKTTFKELPYDNMQPANGYIIFALAMARELVAPLALRASEVPYISVASNSLFAVQLQSWIDACHIPETAIKPHTKWNPLDLSDLGGLSLNSFSQYEEAEHFDLFYGGLEHRSSTPTVLYNVSVYSLKTALDESLFSSLVDVIQSFNHPNVAPFVGSFSFPPFRQAVIYESPVFYGAGVWDLATVRDLARGLQYLHQNGVVPRQVSFTSMMSPFGPLWLIPTPFFRSTKSARAEEWMSPETMAAAIHYGLVGDSTSQSNVFSFGMITYRFLLHEQKEIRVVSGYYSACSYCGTDRGWDSKMIPNLITDGPTISFQPTSLYPSLHPLIRRCLQRDPSKRPDINEILIFLESMPEVDEAVEARLKSSIQLGLPSERGELWKTIDPRDPLPVLFLP